MSAVRLLRRREVPVPTLAGWIALIAVGALACVAFGLAIYPYLAPDAPVGKGLLVVEGWAGAPAFDDATARFRRGGYSKIVATGGPIESDAPLAGQRTWAQWAAYELVERGIDERVIAIVPTPPSARERTYLSAVMVRDWIATRGEPVPGLDVVSLGTHGRRTWRLYREAFGDALPIGIISAPSREFDPDAWWRSSEGTKSVITEVVGYAWTLCCFDPGPRGSQQEKWGD